MKEKRPRLKYQWLKRNSVDMALKGCERGTSNSRGDGDYKRVPNHASHDES